MVEIWAIPIWNGHCAGTCCSVQPGNKVIRVQGSLNLTFAHTGEFGQNLATRAGWFVWYTNIMMHLVLTRGLSGRDMGNTNLKWSLCGHALFSST